MVLRLLIATLLMPTLSFAQEQGWSVAMGVVGNTIVGQPKRPFFPAIRSDSAQLMLIPGATYQGESFSFGTDGVGYKMGDETLGTNIKVGFPRSNIDISGKRGWLRYGLKAGLTGGNGWVSEYEMTLGPLSYGIWRGLGDREQDRQQQFSLAAPLFIGQNDTFILGKLFTQQANDDFIHNRFQLSHPILAGSYWQHGVEVFSVWPVSQSLTVINSTSVTWSESRLRQELPELEQPLFSTFLLLNYRFNSKL